MSESNMMLRAEKKDAGLSKEEVTREIKKIENHVDKTWDRGLEREATEVISLTRSLIQEIESGERPDWLDDATIYLTTRSIERKLFDLARKYWDNKK